jgi:hypothetical protein
MEEILCRFSGDWLFAHWNELRTVESSSAMNDQEAPASRADFRRSSQSDWSVAIWSLSFAHTIKVDSTIEV